MGSRNRGSVAVGDATQVTTSALVVSSADVGTLNSAITGLANRAPNVAPVRMLYERWAKFSASPARQKPDVELEPVLRAFAVAYRAVGKHHAVTLDPRMLELAPGEAVAIDAAGKQLDAALARINGTKPGKTVGLKQLALIAGGAFLASKFLGKKSRGKRR